MYNIKKKLKPKDYHDEKSEKQKLKKEQTNETEYLNDIK